MSSLLRKGVAESALHNIKEFKTELHHIILQKSVYKPSKMWYNKFAKQENIYVS